MGSDVGRRRPELAQRTRRVASSSCSVRHLDGVQAESLAGDSLDSSQIRARALDRTGGQPNFFAQARECMSRMSGCAFSDACLRRAGLGFARQPNEAPVEKPDFIGISFISQRIRQLHRPAARAPIEMRCGKSAHARSGVIIRANALHQAKMLVFLSHCSNPNAVFAIPAGTSRHRHSLTARRAAWRRSERRRRSQRRRKARARPRRAGKSRVLSASSLRLGITSLTASHGPARVEVQ